MELISLKAACDAIFREYEGYPYGERARGLNDAVGIILDEVPTIPAVPLDKLCELLAYMYHCPSSGWPSSGHACHPDCPDEVFEKLCGTGCENYSDAERWKAFLAKWLEEQDENN